MKTIVIESSEENGKEVALLVSEQTGIPFFDTQTVLDTAEKLGADVAFLKPYEEENFGSLVYSLFISSNRYENRTVQKTLSALAEAIRLLYRKNNGGIFMGKFTAEILSELDMVFVAHIESSNTSQSNHSFKLHDIGDVSQSSNHKLGHPEHFTVCNKGNNYNIMLRKSVKSLDQCANSIIHLAEL